MEKLIELFADAIDRTDAIVMSDHFREYEEWGSLAYLSVIAMLDEEYDLQMELAEFKQLITIEDIYNATHK